MADVGRPTALTPDVVGKLEQSLQNGFTVTKACEIAGIHRDTYYAHLNSNEAFSDRMMRSQNFALEVARQNVVNAIIKGKDVNTSRWYLERKAKNEFGSRTEITGAEGTSLNTGVDELKEIAETLKKAINVDSESNSQEASQ